RRRQRVRLPRQRLRVLDVQGVLQPVHEADVCFLDGDGDDHFDRGAGGGAAAGLFGGLTRIAGPGAVTVRLATCRTLRRGVAEGLSATLLPARPRPRQSSLLSATR